MPSPLVHKEQEEEIPPVAPPVKSSEIMVKANRQGFYKNVRRQVGDEFSIPSLDKLGEWMTCVDPKLEMEHKRRIKEKKNKIAGK